MLLLPLVVLLLCTMSRVAGTLQSSALSCYNVVHTTTARGLTQRGRFERPSDPNVAQAVESNYRVL